MKYEMKIHYCKTNSNSKYLVDYRDILNLIKIKKLKIFKL